MQDPPENPAGPASADTRQLIVKFAALIVLLLGAFVCVLGASTGRWWMLGPGLPLIGLAIAMLVWEVIARNRGRPQG